MTVEEIKAPYPEESEEKPKKLAYWNVKHWSSHYKDLVIKGKKKLIGAKALKFIEYDCIEYYKDAEDPKKNCYTCKAIELDNEKFNSMKWNGSIKDFECDCQYNKKNKKMCSHILALYLQLKIWNWNK